MSADFDDRRSWSDFWESSGSALEAGGVFCNIYSCGFIACRKIIFICWRLHTAFRRKLGALPSYSSFLSFIGKAN